MRPEVPGEIIVLGTQHMADETAQEVIVGAEGAVKWFDPRKGYGFILGPAGQDIFAHYTVIEGDGFKMLRDDATVIFDAVKTPKGWRAVKVARHESIHVSSALALPHAPASPTPGDASPPPRPSGYSNTPRGL